MAGMPLSFCQEISGFTQISLTIEAYLSPQDFLSRFERARRPMNKYGLAIILISDSEGELKKEIEIKDFGGVQTIFSYMLNCKRGSSIKKTIDSLTAPGELYLISDDHSAIREDYYRIREQEAQGLYRHAVEVISAEKELTLLTDKESSIFYLGLWKEKLASCASLPAAQ